MKGDFLYAWQTADTPDSWSLVGALIPELGTHQQPLISRDENIVREVFGPIARKHAEAMGQRVRFVRLAVDQIEEGG